MIKKFNIQTIPIEFQKRLAGGCFHTSLLFALMSLVAALTMMGAQAIAQEGEPRRIQTQFHQGDERYPANILLDRVAFVLTEKVSADKEIYGRIVRLLGGRPVEGLSRKIIGIDAPGVDSVEELKARISALLDQNADELSEFGELRELIADTGLFVTVAASQKPRVMTDRIIVWIDADRDLEFLERLLGEFDAELVGRNPFNRRSFVIRAADDDTLKISNLINGQTGVSFALPDFYIPGGFRQASIIPDDEFFSYQWHLHNGDGLLGTEDADIDADLAWSFGLGSSDILIAVIDSGVETDHPDLAAAIWTHPGETADNHIDDDGNHLVDDVHGWDFTSCPDEGPISDLLPCGDNDVTPLITHGTGVAGAAVARAFNGRSQAGAHHEGVVGVCPNCSLLPIRINARGSPHSMHVLSIQYAASLDADIINISWGYDPEEVVPMNIKEALADAADEGIVIFIAMSNDSYDNCNPDFPNQPDLSSHPKVIAVAGSTNEDLVSTPGGFGECLSVLAPTDGGTKRPATTDMVGYDGYNARDQVLFADDCDNPNLTLDPDRAYTFCFGGLSFSAPLAAGVAGLLLSHNNSLTWMDVKRLLQDTADKISNTEANYSIETGYSSSANGAHPKHGYGRINAFEAVRVVAGPGRHNTDTFFRDNGRDWGNTEQPSSTTFEANSEPISYWQSADIKIDAPPLRTSPPGNADELACLNSATNQIQTGESNAGTEAPQTSVEFGCFAHEDPTPGVLNRIYVRAHNRGVSPATNVRVKLLWATHPDQIAPDLPSDFWSAFASQMDASDTSTWHPLSTQTVTSLAYSGASVAGSEDDASAIFAFDFNAPVFDQDDPNAGHLTILAILDSRDDPVSPETTLSQDLGYITPRDNNVTQLTMPLGAQMIAGLTDQQFDVQARKIGRRFGSLEYRRARWHFAQPQ